MKCIRYVIVGLLVMAGWSYAQPKKIEKEGAPAKIARVYLKNITAPTKSTTGKYGVSKYPLSESFETFPPYGWTVVTNGAAGNNGWQQTSTQAHSGVYSAYHDDDNADCSSWLITPPLIITDTDTLLTFWQYQKFGSWYNYHGIWVDTNAGTDTLNFFELQVLPAGTDYTWEQITINLSAFINDTITIAFKYQGNYADEWYIDDVSGPEVVLPDTVGPVISFLVAPLSHFYTGTEDIVTALITDPSGVQSADLYYSTDIGNTWNTIPMTNTAGDTFTAILPPMSTGSKVLLYVSASDNNSNTSNSDYTYYTIMPSGSHLIVYYNSDEFSIYATSLTFNNIEPLPDYMYVMDARYTYGDSLPLWTTLWYSEPGSNDTTVLINFLNSGTGDNRKHLIIFGDDVGWSLRGTNFYNNWLRSRYIQDDLSSLTDNDTIVGISGDGISDGMPPFTISSLWPDMVEPYSPYGDMDISWKFLIATTGDSTNTAGGLAYNGLTYILEYLPFNITDIDSQKYVDTLFARINNFNSTAGLPPIADWANTQWPHATTVNIGDSTELIFGQIWEPGLTDVGSDVNKDSIRAQLGFGPDGTIPYEAETLWTWIDARFNVISWNNYEYMARIYADSTLLPGHYDYCFRYSIKEGGVWGPWIYADINGTGEKGKAYNYNYDPSQAGDLVVQRQYPILTIPEIQDTTGTGSDASAHAGDTVATFGIVTGVYSYGFFLEEKPAKPWGGIWVYVDSTPTVSVGDSIYIAGVVSEYYGLTELGDIQDLMVIRSGVTLPDPITVTTQEANDEQYEGVLLKTQGICTNPDLGYGEWEIDDGTGPLRIDDMGVPYTPDSGTKYIITAPLYYSYGDFKLEPRDSSDIVAVLYSRVKINEVYYDSPGDDNGCFTELYGPPGMPLDNMMLVGINGANNSIYATIDLTGDTIPPDGFFVVAQDTTVPNYDKVDTLANWQNGSDNIQLWYIDGADTIIVDAIGYGSSDTTTWYFRGEGLPAEDVYGGRSLVRYPDGKDTDDNSVDFHATSFRTPGLPNKIGIFFDDFEAGTGNWTGDWENTAEDAYSGDSSYTDTANANYPNNAVLIGMLANPLNLSQYPSYTLEFWTKHFIEDGWDYGYVEVSTDSSTWAEVASFTGDSANWYHVSLDLSAFAGNSTVWIRFKLVSDQGVSEAGWFVDDVLVSADLTDNSPPLISHTRPPFPPEGQTSAIGNVTITATILDYSPIAEDSLYYSVDGGSFTAVGHDSVIGNTYYFTIPAQPSGALVTYYITAADTAGNSASTSTYRYYAGELISFDDGDPAYYYAVHNTDTLAVQFGNTVTDTFVHITSALFYFYTYLGVDSFDVHIWDASGNDVVTPIRAYPDTSNPNIGWTVVDLRPYEIYIFPGTELYVGYTTLPGDTVPGILIDYPSNFQHSFMLQSGTWQMINFDLFIRVLTDRTTGVHEGLTTLPKVFMLGPNYPNPFRGQTVIKYALPKDAHVTLEIYDISGRKVKTLVNGFEKAGWKTAVWNGTNDKGEKVKSGIYFYRMKAGEFLKTRKMVYVK